MMQKSTISGKAVLGSAGFDCRGKQPFARAAPSFSRLGHYAALTGRDCERGDDDGAITISTGLMQHNGRLDPSGRASASPIT
jgi:hypothetical protein